MIIYEKRLKLGLVLASIFSVLLLSCVSVNRLDEYSFEGSAFSVAVSAPSRGEVELGQGTLPGSQESTLIRVLEIGANVMVGLEEQKLEDRIAGVLTGDEISASLEREFIPETLDFLLARERHDQEQADFFMEVEVLSFGLYSSGRAAGYTLGVELESRIFHHRSGNLVWRRRLSASENASPSVFGFNDFVGAAMTIGMLSEVGDEQLREGFIRLADSAAQDLALSLREDYFRARSR